VTDSPDFATKPTLRGELADRLEKAGFRAEGVLREFLRYNGARVDAAVMSILAPEWPPPAPAPPPAHGSPS
jgi:hypothetical protein